MKTSLTDITMLKVQGSYVKLVITKYTQMYYKLLGFMLLPIVFGVACVKEKNCVVKSVTTVNEIIIDSTYVERQYIVELECYD
jgi:hypothetical protein